MAKEVSEFQAKLTAKDDASKVIDQAAKAGEDFDGSIFSAETEVENAKALQELRELQDQADETRQRIEADEIEPKVDSTKAKEGFDELGDSAKRAGDESLQSAGDFRDVAGALGDVDTGALDAAEGLIGLREVLGQFSGSSKVMQGIVGALGEIAGPATLAALAVVALRSVVDKVEEQFADYDGALQNVIASTAKLGPGLTANTKKFIDQAKAAKDTKNTIENVWTTALFSPLGLFNSLTQDATSNLDIFNDVLKESPGAAKALLDIMAQAPDAFGDTLPKATEDLRAYEDQAALTSAGQKQLTDEVNLLTHARELGINTTGRSIDSIRAEVDQIDRATAAWDKTRNSIDLTKGSISGINTEFDKVRDDFLTGEAAQIRQRQMWEDLKKSIDDTGPSLDDKKLKIIDFFNAVKTTEGDAGVLNAIAELKKQVAPGSPLSIWLDQMENKLAQTFRDREANIKVNVQYPNGRPGGREVVAVMAGTPYAQGGSYLVGEAGPELVHLPRGARVDTAGRTMMAEAGAGQTIQNTYNITVNVPIGSPTAQVGRYVTDAIAMHEARTGSRRRAVA